MKWAFGFPNGSSAFAQPAVAGGRVFVGSDNGFLYSLDAATGCVYWSFEATAGIRTAVSIGTIKTATGTRAAAYFGDLKANVFAVDAETGAQIWTQRVDTHPFARITGAPTLANGKLYVPVSSFEEGSGANDRYECCTFRGSVAALDAATGARVWQSYTIDPPQPTKKNSAGTQLYAPSGNAIWSSPTIDLKRNVVYIATGNEYSGEGGPMSDAVIAFDLNTGERKWASQVTPKDVYVVGCNAKRENCPADEGPDFDFGNSAILRDLPNGKSLIVIGQKSGVVWALDPDKQRRHCVATTRRQGQRARRAGVGLGRRCHDRIFPGLGFAARSRGRRWSARAEARDRRAGVVGASAARRLQGSEELHAGAVGRRDADARRDVLGHDHRPDARVRHGHGQGDLDL